MKTYVLKKLVNGYKVNPRHKGTNLVALPFKFVNEKILVKHSDKKMIIDQDTPLLGDKTFPDKFGRDKTYTLYYYQWQPTKNQVKLKL
tara:strand:+ start:633 stop:896 length:264 start_codon:yes stop_codon:yes gene_type:complete